MANSFYESFDNGTGALNHTWGSSDASVKGQVTLRGNSGVMERPSGSDAGHGYGQYTVTAKLEGNQVGPAALLWPSNDKWPGTELDFAEILPDGTSYGTAHRNNGGDWYDARMYWGNDEGGVHTYGIDWQADHVSFSVDGRDAGTVWMNTQDAAHGGTNVVFGAMNRSDATSITVYDMSYTPSGGGTTPATTTTATTPATTTTTATTPAAKVESAPAAAPAYEPAPVQSEAQQPSAPAPVAQSEAVDWNALAAQAMANYEATGHWFM